MDGISIHNRNSDVYLKRQVIDFNMTLVKCKFCGKEFEKTQAEINKHPSHRHFCSTICYTENKRRKPFICSNCGKEYLSEKPHIYEKNFCSNACLSEYTNKRNDFTGKKIGRCEVISLDDENSHKDKYWLLKCQCGEVFSVRHVDIRRGNVYECPNCVFRRSDYYLGGKKFGRLHVQDEWEWRTSKKKRKKI